MTEAVAEARSVYLDEFERLPEQPAWNAALRRRGIDAFEARGFPGRHLEAWRKVKLAPVTAQHFPRAEGAGEVDADLAGRIEALSVRQRIVFVDGRYSAQLSALDGLPTGVTVTPFSGYDDNAPERLTASLGRLADPEGNAFAALNSALFADGAFVHVSRGALVEEPVAIVHVTTGAAADHAVYPRVLVDIESGAQARFIERFVGADGTGALVAPVTEIHVGDGANLSWDRLQEQGDATLDLGVLAIAAGRDAVASTRTYSFGGRLVRLDLVADLNDTGAEVSLDGLYLTAGRQFADFHTWVNHRKPHGQSSQVFKGILQGRSETIFDGLVKVFEGAQKTDAQQQNRNLILDKLALAHSNPRLEIHADDVKCAHGSTVGELDDDALFYLRSRGIDAADAQALLTVAFAGEVVNATPLEIVRAHVQSRLMARLPAGASAGEAP